MKSPTAITHEDMCPRTSAAGFRHPTGAVVREMHPPGFESLLSSTAYGS